jgi:PhnB protein
VTHHVNPVPDGYHTATVALTVDDGVGALAFYQKALGATERMRSSRPDGQVTHAEIQVGDSVIMISQEMPGMGSRSPKTLGGSGAGLYLYVPDADALYHRAVAAGATSLSPPEDMFWGDRHARIRDPFGHEWSIATHQEDLTVVEIDRRAQEFYGRMANRPDPKPSST